MGSKNINKYKLTNIFKTLKTSQNIDTLNIFSVTKINPLLTLVRNLKTIEKHIIFMNNILLSNLSI